MRVLNLRLHQIKCSTLSLDYVSTKVRVKFNGDCLKQEKITFNHGKIINIYIVYEIERSLNKKMFAWCSQISKAC